jgi:hypothetical protein
MDARDGRRPGIGSTGANFRANAFAGSIETEDNGHPDTDPWTAAQLDTLVWLSPEMRRPRPLIARRKWRTSDDAGIGYHSLFPGQWTNVPGKTCPGRIRIRQWGERVLPRSTWPARSRRTTSRQSRPGSSRRCTRRVLDRPEEAFNIL